MLEKIIKLIVLIFASIIFGFLITSISLLAQALIGIDFNKHIGAYKLLIFLFIVGYIPADMLLDEHK